MVDRYVLAVSPSDHSILLGLESRTKEESQQLIRWMLLARFNMTYVITTYDPAADHFVAEDGAVYRPGSAPFTEKAWDEFQRDLRQRHKLPRETLSATR